MMMYPPSLPEGVRERAFRASNGELGILPADASAYLAACRSDGVEVLGWELWIVDHYDSPDGNDPIPAKGSWCGSIPVVYGDVHAIIGGEGDIDETERQLSSTHLAAEVQTMWLPYVRVNFTLKDMIN